MLRLCLFLIYIISVKSELSINKISLTFVIDKTKSMRNDQNEVRLGVDSIFDEIVESYYDLIDNIILVTFADPDVTLEAKVGVNDKDVFKNSLKFPLVSGIDCPEFSLSGIETAILNSHRYSLIYVFTDAAAKDHEKFDTVKNLAQSKEIQIVFVLTGKCSKYNDKQVYQRLADITGGQVFFLNNKHNINEILDYITKTMNLKHYLIERFPPKYDNKLNVTFDCKIKGGVFISSGTMTKIEITGPDGSKLPTDYIVDLNNVKALKINEPVPGEYTVTLGSKTNTTFIVLVDSDVYFKHGFSTFEPLSLRETTVKPIPDVKSYLTIQLFGNITLKEATLFDLNKNILISTPLKYLNEQQNLYITEAFEIPRTMFRILVTGINPCSNDLIVRLGRTIIDAQSMPSGVIEQKLPKVIIEYAPDIIIDYNETIKLMCKIKAYPQPEVIWENVDNKTVVISKLYQRELPYKYMSVLKLDNVTKNATYQCTATNTVGTNSKKVFVGVTRKPFLKIDGILEDIFIEYNFQGVINCNVKGYPLPTISWTKNGIQLYNTDNLNISTNGSIVIIQNMNVTDQGTYVCKATNGVEDNEGRINVKISGVDIPKIDDSITTIYSLEGQNSSINCRIIKGKPKPTIRWFYQNESSSILTELKEFDDNELYTIKNVNKSNAGTYVCEAKNFLRKNQLSITFVVEYPPKLNNTETVTYKLNEYAKLSCEAKGIPIPVIKWVKKEKILDKPKFTIDSRGNLIFKVELTDNGNYTCIATNKHGTANKTVLLEVEKKPTVSIDGNTTILADYDKPLELKCNVNSNPRPIIIWKDENGKKYNSNVSPAKTKYDYLSILNIDKINHNSTYKCMASNKYGGNAKKVMVMVRKPFCNVKKKPGDTSIEYKKEGKLHCEVDAYPAAKIVWYKNGAKLLNDSNVQISEDSSTITLKSMAPGDRGYYICAVSCDGNFTFYVDISGVEIPELEPLESEVKILENSSTTLHCKISKGKPKPLISWFYSSKGSSIRVEILEARGKEVLTLSNIQRNETGTYICKAENFMKKVETETALVVEYPPLIASDDVSNITIIEGDEVTLPCSVDGVPKPTVTWSRDDKILSSPKYIIDSKNSLLFRTDRDSVGIYKCKAVNKLGTLSRNVTVNVEFGPFVNVSEGAYITLGYKKPLILHCNGYGNPEVDIEWRRLRDANVLTSTVSKVETYKYENILFIPIVKNSDVYECFAHNKHGNSTVTVNVEKEPYFHVVKKPEDAVIPYKHRFKIPCLIDAYPEENITWYKNGEVLTTNTHAKVAKSLIIYGMEPSDTGTYICEARNNFERRLFRADINISGVAAPNILEENKNVYLRLGKKSMLNCSVEGIPKPNVEWYKDGIPIDRSIIFISSNNSISFESKFIETEGIFECVATNEIDKAVLRLDVKVYYLRSARTVRKKEIIEEESLDLFCKVEGTPPPTYKWIYTSVDPMIAPVTLRWRSKKITLDDISYEQRGNYTCVAYNIGGSVNVTYVVDVYTELKTMEETKKSYLAVDGDWSLKVKCNVTGNPKPIYNWLRNGVDISTGDKYEIKDEFLIIKNLTYRDSGNYICKAKNTIGTHPDDYNVTVHVSPSEVYPNTTLLAEVYKETLVKCYVPHTSTDRLRWYFKGNKIHEGELLFKRVLITDSGLYTCRVDSVNDTRSWNTILRVGKIPEFLRPQKDSVIELDRNERNYLDCETFDRPDSKIKWTRNGVPIDIKERFFQINTNNFKQGTYKCEVINEFGSINRTFYVSFKDCLLKVGSKSKSPLILAHSLTWPKFDYLEGNLLVPKNKDIRLICPTKIKGFTTNIINARCNHDGSFNVEVKNYEHLSFDCDTEYKITTEKTSEICYKMKYKKGNKYKIGYKVLDQLIVVYEVCFDILNKIPIFTKNIMHNPRIDEYEEATWNNDGIKEFNFDKMYSKEWLLNTISRQLRRPFHYDDKCTFSKLQLVSPMDAFPGIPQRATYSYLNVVPYWECQSANWAEIGRRVRSLLKVNSDLIVWTGIAYNLELLSNRKLSKIFIMDDKKRHQPVPKYLWKVVQNPDRNSSLAIIQLNIPDVTSYVAPSHVLCKDICNTIPWLADETWHDVKRGYTFCCSLKEFEKKFGFKNIFKPWNKVLFEM